MRPLAAALIIAMSPTSASAQQGDAFAQGRLSPLLGFGFATSDTGLAYIIVGGGLGYYVLDGLEVSFDVEHWIATAEGFNDITKIRPGVRYVRAFMNFHPYVGMFYRHWFVHGGVDADTVGTRIGVIFMLGQRLFVDVGAMYEYVLSSEYPLQRGVWTVPNIGIGFTF